MRTVLCSRSARRAAGLLAALVAVGAAGSATPASAAAHRVGDHPAHHTARGEAVLGPAVKYVRAADGTIRRVR